jgi:hypothetical protein
MRFFGPISLLIVIAAIPFIDIWFHRQETQRKRCFHVNKFDNMGAQIQCTQCGEGVMQFSNSEYLIHTSFRLYCLHCGKSEVFRLVERLDSLSGFPHQKLVLYRQKTPEEWESVLDSEGPVGFWG